MNLTLPTTGVLSSATHLVISFTKKFRLLFLGLSLLALSFSSQAQSDPEVIQNWQRLEEADFYFDVSYSVVKCSADATPIILLNAFNEGGAVSAIGFTLKISDKAGNSATVEIDKFNTGFGDMYIASCGSEEHSNLKFNVPDGIDATSLSIEITYNK